MGLLLFIGGLVLGIVLGSRTQRTNDKKIMAKAMEDMARLHKGKAVKLTPDEITRLYNQLKKGTKDD